MLTSFQPELYTGVMETLGAQFKLLSRDGDRNRALIGAPVANHGLKICNFKRKMYIETARTPFGYRGAIHSPSAFH